MEYYELGFAALVVIALIYISRKNRLEQEEECKRKLMSLEASMWNYNNPKSPIYDKERVEREYAEALALAEKEIDGD